ncbi:MAG: formyltransferase family protein [Cyanobacteriota bacterium]|nr:formyltransferase family protein [Cyanobacteriota bacterium]
MKKIALYNTELIKPFKQYFASNDVEVKEISSLGNTDDFDMVIIYNCPDFVTKNSINIHPALLPAYKGVLNPIIEAFNDGVKVSGITVHKGDKILAQYPVLLSTDTHFDEFEQDMQNVQNKLVPVVVDCLLQDKVFDFQDLFKSPCVTSLNCKGCGACHK